MIKKCKICGRTPKIKYKDGRYIVICKPWNSRTHWVVEAPTEEKAIEYWNARN